MTALAVGSLLALALVGLTRLLPAGAPDPLWAALAGFLAGGIMARRASRLAGRPRAIRLALLAWEGALASWGAVAAALMFADLGALLREIAYRLLYFELDALPVAPRIAWWAGEIPDHLLLGLVGIVPGVLLGPAVGFLVRRAEPSVAPAPVLASIAALLLAGLVHSGIEDRALAARSREAVPIPAGSFVMGCDDGHPDEGPARRVTLPSFEIDRHEMTIARYHEFLRATGRPRPPGWDDPRRPFTLRPHEPVEAVTWEEAAACARFHGRRLPTEAEWEYAARGADGRRFPWGDQFASDLFNGGARIPRTENRGELDRRNPDARTGGYGVPGNRPAVIGSFPGDRSPMGVMDMAGNVAEWVEGDGPEKVYRGADYGGSSATRARLTFRGRAPAGLRLWGRGFRTAR